MGPMCSLVWIVVQGAVVAVSCVGCDGQCMEEGHPYRLLYRARCAPKAFVGQKVWTWAAMVSWISTLQRQASPFPFLPLRSQFLSFDVPFLFLLMQFLFRDSLTSIFQPQLLPLPAFWPLVFRFPLALFSFGRASAFLFFHVVAFLLQATSCTFRDLLLFVWLLVAASPTLGSISPPKHVQTRNRRYLKVSTSTSSACTKRRKV
eukprot:m.208326 g.208326  ORF g.208326 m.208326 type:complete len:204 (-) comp15039_c0_seq1:150-761(-)